MKIELKIILINPEYPDVDVLGLVGYRPRQPLCLAYTSSVLRERGHETEIVDMRASKLSLDDLEKLLRREGYDWAVVTTSPLDMWQCPFIDYSRALKAVGICKANGTRTIVVGPHGTATPGLLFEQSHSIDIVVRGEPEYTIREIVEESLDKVRGISFRERHGIRHNPDRPFIDDLDELPFPAYDQLPMNKYHYHSDILPDPFTIIISSRGCPYQCVFCLKIMYGDKYRTRSPGNVADELEMLVEEYGVKSVYFQDLEFALDRRRAMDICDEMKRRALGLTWAASLRVTDVNEEFMRKAKAAGCVRLFFGIESCSPRILRNIRKEVSIEAMVKACKLCKKWGIDFNSFWIAGLPGETYETIEESMKIGLECGIPHPLVRPLVMPYIGTPLYEMAKKQGLIKRGDWDECRDLAGRVGVRENIRRTYTLKSAHLYLRNKYGSLYWLNPSFHKRALSIFWGKVKTAKDKHSLLPHPEYP